MRRVVVVFLDGVGIGPFDPAVNPFLAAHLPALHEAFGGQFPLLGEERVEGPGGIAFPLDAQLEMEGTPQSGTGQVSLFTGQNAAALFGRHFGPWTPVGLRPLLTSENFLRRAVEAGVSSAFANAYPRDFLENRRFRRVAAPPLAAHSAGLLVRDQDALGAGNAVASEIVNDGWRAHLGFHDLPEPTPREAGRTLARIAAAHRLTFFAHYHTDLAGHRGGMGGAIAALERVDSFLAGLLGALPPDGIVLGVSDHGNIEDVRVGHTRNPALGFLLGGEGGAALPLPSSLLHVAPWVLRALGVELPEEPAVPVSDDGPVPSSYPTAPEDSAPSSV